MKKLIVELLGTFWLVLTGCGSAVIAASYPELGIGFVGVSLAFGLSVVSMAYAIGHISGCHLNPAVTLGMVVSERMELFEAFKYILSQVLGAVLGASFLYLIVSGNDAVHIGSFASNGFGEHSPMGYSMLSCFLTEFIMTYFFVFIILNVTSKQVNTKFAGLVIGLTLTLIHLVSIPITNTSVNPARSTAQALFASVTWPAEQLWMFWVAPILGAIVAGLVYKLIDNKI
jgi:aquaporin Z